MVGVPGSGLKRSVNDLMLGEESKAGRARAPELNSVGKRWSRTSQLNVTTEVMMGWRRKSGSGRRGRGGSSRRGMRGVGGSHPLRALMPELATTSPAVARRGSDLLSVHEWNPWDEDGSGEEPGDRYLWLLSWRVHVITVSLTCPWNGPRGSRTQRHLEKVTRLRRGESTSTGVENGGVVDAKDEVEATTRPQSIAHGCPPGANATY